MTTLETKIRTAEDAVFASAGLAPDVSFIYLRRTGTRVRVLSFGSGQPVLFLHGVSLGAAVWAPLLAELIGFRLHVVELPGHGLSGPATYRRGAVRAQAARHLDDLFDVLSGPMPVIGHSLGAMFALWHAATSRRTITSLVVLGAPAVALPGATVRLPLSLMTVPVVGPAVLRSPSPRSLYRRLLALGLGPDAVAASSDDLIDVLRFASRRPDNARTVAALMHAINGFRRPRPESVMDAEELRQVTTPTVFLWGANDVYLSPGDAVPWIETMPSARLEQLSGGHAPWFTDPAACARKTTQHLTETGFPSADSSAGPGDPAT